MSVYRILIIGWLAATALSAETAIKETYQIPMRDGTLLATDVYRPAGSKAYPVLLHRTPYGKGDQLIPETFVNLLVLVKGYALVFQDTRGRFASQGVDSVFFTDGWGALQDGYDTVDWLTKQSWCNGRVALYGASASGITTYRAVGSLHPAIKCAVSIVAPTDLYHQVIYPGGEFGKALVEGWVAGQGSLYMIDYMQQFPYYAPLWDEMNLHTRTDSIHIPILHIGGWYDCFSAGPVAAFNDLLSHAPQKLIMGPWIHHTTGSNTQVGEITYPSAYFDLIGEALSWFDRWMTSGTAPAAKPEVHYYLMGDPARPRDGGCRWLEAEAWPPANAKRMAWYLNKSGSLTTQPEQETNQLSYTYDPSHPVETLGGNNLNLEAGPKDQRPVDARPDVLGFVSEPLSEPLRMEGYGRGLFYVSSDQPDTDFTLKLIDVYPDGREMLVVDGVQRARFRYGYLPGQVSWLQPGVVDTLSISLPPTALVFSTGHRIKIALSSSNYPRFELNPNNDLDPNDRGQSRIAVNTIHFGGSWSSRIELPVMQSASGVTQTTELPQTCTLSPAFPNPFNSSVRLDYQLAHPARVQAAVYTMTGEKVCTLLQARQTGGEHWLGWSGDNERGVSMPSGVYMIRLRVDGRVQTQKVTLVR